mmetsp:Transcript_63951/g.140842  ORF Transcript_63951/g.140842 Transcript_63951/m.140842 type:complete len:339 (+) Transcript_63951:1246-2262(+)
MQSELGLHLDLLGLGLCGQVNLEGAQGLLCSRQEARLVGVLRLYFKGAFAVEGQKLQGVQGRARGEDGGRLVLTLATRHQVVAVLLLRRFRIRCRAHPADAHGEWRDVLDLEVADLVEGREDGCLQCTTACHALVRVHRGRELLATEGGRAHLLHPGHPASATHYLHGVELLWVDASGCCRCLCALKHGFHLIHHGLAHLQEQVAGDVGPEIVILHKALAAEACLGVRRKDLLCLCHCVLELEGGLLGRERVATVLLLELLSELPHEALVHVAATHLVRFLADHGQLPPHKLHNGDGENRVAHAAKADCAGLLRIEVIGPINTVAKRSRRVLVHEAQD